MLLGLQRCDAMSVGLVVTEGVINALKHAFVNRRGSSAPDRHRNSLILQIWGGQFFDADPQNARRVPWPWLAVPIARRGPYAHGRHGRAHRHAGV
jgi:hypothetical protein